MNSATSSESAAAPDAANRSRPPKAARTFGKTSFSASFTAAHSRGPIDLPCRCLFFAAIAVSNIHRTARGFVSIIALIPAWIRFQTRGTAKKTVGFTSEMNWRSFAGSPQMAVGCAVGHAAVELHAPPEDVRPGKNATPQSSGSTRGAAGWRTR